MANISMILDNFFTFFSINLFGSTVLFSLFLIAILVIFLFQMGATRYVALAFVVPLIFILATEAAWITETWIGYLGIILIAVLLFIIMRRMFAE